MSCFGCGQAIGANAQFVTALDAKWHPACLRCAHCNVQLELGKAKCDTARRTAFCTLECAVAATAPPAAGNKASGPRAAHSVPSIKTAAPPVIGHAQQAATDVGVGPQKHRLNQLERVLDLRDGDLAELQAQIQREAKASPPQKSSAIASPPLSPTSADQMDPDDLALLEWRRAEQHRADLERELAVVVERVDSRRKLNAAVHHDDEQRIATLRREVDVASAEVETRAAKAKAKHKQKHHHHRSSGKTKKTTPRSRSPSPPPPASASPVVPAAPTPRSTAAAAAAAAAPAAAAVSPRAAATSPRASASEGSPSVAAVVQNARAGDTSTMAARRDHLKDMLAQRRIDLSGEETISFK